MSLNKSRQGNLEKVQFVDGRKNKKKKKEKKTRTFVAMFLWDGSNPVEADGTSQRDVGGFFYSVGFRLGSRHKSKGEEEESWCNESLSLCLSMPPGAPRARRNFINMSSQRGFGKSTTPKVNVCLLFFFLSLLSVIKRLIVHHASVPLVPIMTLPQEE